MKKTLVFLLAISLLLVACNFDISADLYMQDIIDAQELGETLYANATLAVEFSGDEEDRQQIVAILEEELNEVENIREEEKDYSTYLVVDYKIPLIAGEELEGIYSHPEVQNNIFTFAVTSNILNIVFNKARFDALDASLYDQFYQHLEFENFAMSLYLQNDLRTPVDLTFYSVYANNEPIPYQTTLTLDRRDEIEIKFSDVLRDSATTPSEAETEGVVVRKFAEFQVVEE